MRLRDVASAMNGVAGNGGGDGRGGGCSAMAAASASEFCCTYAAHAHTLSLTGWRICS